MTETRTTILDRLTNPSLTVRETALILGVCRDTVRRWDKAGLLPSTRTPTGYRRFRLSSIVERMETMANDADRRLA